MTNIDFLIVGSGLYGATIARLLSDVGFNCLIIENRKHIAGNIYTENINGYDKHMYGPHIFHTDNKEVMSFISRYETWISYQQHTIATDYHKIYHLPFNMNTYYDIFGVGTSEEAYEKIQTEIKESGIKNPKNLEEQAISMVGKTIYEKLIKNYTEKQWGKPCKWLNPEIIKRLPLRFEWNNNYFNDYFQAIPEHGYTKFIQNIIGNIPCLCNCQFTIDNYDYWKDNVKYNIIYCGAVDELLNYTLGELEWRSLEFIDNEYIYNGHNGQGTSILNDVSNSKYTRYVEHMWFTPNKIYDGIKSIITSEQPITWERGKEKYYAINNEKTDKLYKEYCNLLKKEMPKIKLGGRLGKYRYFDMDDTILEAINDFKEINEIYNKII